MVTYEKHLYTLKMTKANLYQNSLKGYRAVPLPKFYIMVILTNFSQFEILLIKYLKLNLQ